jgi:hypothetical protein
LPSAFRCAIASLRRSRAQDDLRGRAFGYRSGSALARRK